MPRTHKHTSKGIESHHMMKDISRHIHERERVRVYKKGRKRGNGVKREERKCKYNKQIITFFIFSHL